MQPLRILGVLAAVVLAAAAAAPARDAAVPSGRQREQRARQIGAEAYVYGSALLDEQLVIDHFPANQLISVTRLSTPAERLVVLPNVDTLYTVARLTLSGGPQVIHVPDEHGRYYTLELLDAYTNAFGYIGRRVTGTGPGDFAIVGPGWRGRLPRGVQRIDSPTPTAWLLGRTLVHGRADVPRVNAIQRAYTLTPLSGLGGPPSPAAFVPASALGAIRLPSGLGFLDAMDAAMQQNPPPRSQRGLLRRFASVGIGPGLTTSTEPLDAAIRQGLLAGLSDGRRQVTRYGRILTALSQRRHRGWLVPPASTGRYGSDYLLRAYIAATALGANVPREATYLFASADDHLRPLSGAHRYALRFAPGRLPPVSAFWSVTIYDRHGFLVPNRIDRYGIGNRAGRLHMNAHGSLSIAIQHTPPRRGRRNWLPAPRGRFRLSLRLYQPGPSVLHDRWPPPTITRVG